jgi:hypothetical protein
MEAHQHLDHQLAPRRVLPVLSLPPLSVILSKRTEKLLLLATCLCPPGENPALLMEKGSAIHWIKLLRFKLRHTQELPTNIATLRQNVQKVIGIKYLESLLDPVHGLQNA